MEIRDSLPIFGGGLGFKDGFAIRGERGGYVVFIPHIHVYAIFIMVYLYLPYGGVGIAIGVCLNGRVSFMPRLVGQDCVGYLSIFCNWVYSFDGLLVNFLAASLPLTSAPVE